MASSDRLVALIRRVAASTLSPVVAWGNVTGTAPLTVRLAGDTVDIEPIDVSDHLTLSTNDRVVLLKAGGHWIVGVRL